MGDLVTIKTERPECCNGCILSVCIPDFIDEKEYFSCSFTSEDVTDIVVGRSEEDFGEKCPFKENDEIIIP